MTDNGNPSTPMVNTMAASKAVIDTKNRIVEAEMCYERKVQPDSTKTDGDLGFLRSPRKHGSLRSPRKHGSLRSHTIGTYRSFGFHNT